MAKPRDSKSVVRNRDQDDIALLERLVEELGHNEKLFFSGLTEHEKLSAIQMYLESVETGETKKYDLLWEADYVTRPVGIEEFLTNKYYFGSVGNDLYPAWKEELYSLFGEPNMVNEVIVSGAIGCVAGWTKIPLLDGTEPTIKELAESWNGKPLYCYTYDRGTNRVTVGAAYNPHCSGRNVDVWEITYDNGMSDVVTANHPFMMRNKQYLRADRLQVGDSLMPLYRRMSTQPEDRVSGYEMTMHPEPYLEESWEYTHQMVARWKYGHLYKHPFNTIHHKNLTSTRDNDPRHLALTTWAAHFKYHHKHSAERGAKVFRKLWDDPEWRKNFTARRVRDLTASNSNPESIAKRVATRRARGDYEKEAARFREFNTTNHPALRNDILLEDVISTAEICKSLTEVAEVMNCSRQRLYNVMGDSLSSIQNQHLGRYAGRSNISLGKNHTVVKIKYVGKTDVYDIVVPGTNNFATGSGVFTHNTGKTTFAIVALARKLYEILCLRSPTTFFGLSKDMSALVFGLFNMTMRLSQNVHYTKIVQSLNSSPYFRYIATGNVEKMDEGKEGEGAILNMPNNIKFVFGSRAIHSLGNDLIGGMLDETNFSILAADYQVLDLYRNVRRRINSRFPAIPGKGWKSPGLLFLVSSSKGEEDFLEKHIKEATINGQATTRIISKPVWEVKNHIEGMYSGETFKVLIGNGEIGSKVLDPNEVPPSEDLEVIDVPVEHKMEFQLNCDEALQDVAGRAITGGARKMVQIDRITACMRKDAIFRKKLGLDVRRHPFRKDSITITLDGLDYIEDFIIPEMLVNCLDRHRKRFEPIVNPTQSRFIHLDPATSGFYAYGFAMGHIAGFKEVMRRDKATHMLYKAKAPYIYMDIILQITHPPGKEIDLSKIRAFIMWLRSMGYPIGKVTSDSFQAIDTIQTLKKQYFVAEIFSVDKKPEPYSLFRTAVQEERLLFYDYPIFVKELTNLQRDVEGKAFHLPDILKDTVDASCGVVANIMNAKESQFSVAKPISPLPTRPYEQPLTESELLMPEIPYGSNITGIN